MGMALPQYRDPPEECLKAKFWRISPEGVLELALTFYKVVDFYFSFPVIMLFIGQSLVSGTTEKTDETYKFLFLRS